MAIYATVTGFSNSASVFDKMYAGGIVFPSRLKVYTSTNKSVFIFVEDEKTDMVYDAYIFAYEKKTLK